MPEVNGVIEAKWGNMFVKIRSSQLIYLVVIIGIFIIAYMVGSIIAQDLVAVRREHQIIIGDTHAIVTGLNEQLNIMIWMLSIPEAQRPRIIMPPGLQKRIQHPEMFTPREEPVEQQ